MVRWIGVWLFCVVAFMSWAQERKSGELIVELEPGVALAATCEELNQQWPGLQLGFLECLSPGLNIFLVRFEEDAAGHFPELPKLLQQHPEVKFAQWNHTNIEVRSTPNDPQYVAQWHWTRIGAENAWDLATGGMTQNGKDIVIAVVDNGFELNHDDLNGNWWKNTHEIPGNDIDDDTNGYKDDYDGWNVYDDTGHVHTQNNAYRHGTEVSGVIGARTNNSRDVAGANWNIKMLPIMGSSTSVSVVIKSYNYVIEMRERYNRTNGDSGAFIVACNSSFGVDNGKPADYPIWCDMYNQMGEVGILSIGSAPNVMTNVDVNGDVPCTCPSDYLIAVTRTDQSDVLKSGGYGEISMDLAAPGFSILTTMVNNNTGKVNGASYSTAMVTGAIGLMYAALPDTSFDNISPKDLTLKMKSLLLSEGVEKLPSLDGLVNTGGILNMHGAVQAAYHDYQLGLEEQALPAGFKIYPNPAHEKLVLQSITPTLEPLQVTVVNTQGQEMIQTTWPIGGGVNLNTSDWAAGLYVLKINNRSTMRAYKIMIRH